MPSLRSTRLGIACLAAFAGVFAVPPSTVAAGPYTWAVSTIDPNTNMAYESSLAFTPDGTAHFAAWVGLVGLRYGRNSGAGWTFETVGAPIASSTAPGMEDPAPPDAVQLILITTLRLAVAPDGSPWLAHATLDGNHAGRGMLAIRHRVSGGWTSEPLEEMLGRPDLAVDATGAVFATWATPANDVRIGRRAPGGGWTIETARTGAWMPSLGIAPDGVVHLAVIGSGGDLSHLERGPTGWVDTPVAAPVGADAGGPDLAFDGAGRARIAWLETEPYPSTAPNRVHLAKAGAEGWSDEIIVDDGTFKSWPVLAFDAGGTPMVAFNRPGVLDLAIAAPGAGGWIAEAIDTSGNAGNAAAVAFDALGRPWVASSTVGVGLRMAIGQRVVGVPATGAASAGLTLGTPSPSPLVAGAILRCAFAVPAAGRIEVATYDARGALRYRETRRVEGGEAMLAVPTRGLAPGAYWLRVRDGEGREAARRFVIVG